MERHMPLGAELTGLYLPEERLLANPISSRLTESKSSAHPVILNSSDWTIEWEGEGEGQRDGWVREGKEGGEEGWREEGW